MGIKLHVSFYYTSTKKKGEKKKITNINESTVIIVSPKMICAIKWHVAEDTEE